MIVGTFSNILATFGHWSAICETCPPKQASISYLWISVNQSPSDFKLIPGVSKQADCIFVLFKTQLLGIDQWNGLKIKDVHVLKKKKNLDFFDIRHFPFIEVTERTLYENTCFVLRKLFKGKLHSIFLSTRHEHSSTCYQQWRQSLESLSCIFEDASS